MGTVLEVDLEGDADATERLGIAADDDAPDVALALAHEDAHAVADVDAVAVGVAGHDVTLSRGSP